ncbi:hypothetical protein J6590_048175 [Homalodisca vitripennis]|nr:hypothetical protein J6590_048175 [Homalodisca vitripennis]
MHQILGIFVNWGQKLVEQQLLYSELRGNMSTKYGIENESSAINTLENFLGIKVEECGLFVDSEILYLAASSDGIHGSKCLVEL